MSTSEERQATATISVRATPEEREILRRAAAKVIAGAGVPRATLSVSAFILDAALRRAREILDGEG